MRRSAGQERGAGGQGLGRLRRIRGHGGRHERGAAAIEYAIVAPLLFAVLLVAIEVIVILFSDSMLEAAANKVSRLGRLGVPAGETCQAAVRREAESIVRPWVASPNDIRIDVQLYSPGARFQDVDEEGYEPICDAGGRGDIVMYRLMIERAGITGALSWLGTDIVRLERTMIIQNEP